MIECLQLMQPTTKDYKLAAIILNHSLHLKPKEHLTITADSGAFPLVKAIYEEALKIGAYPIVDTQIDFMINRAHIGGLRYQFYKLANDWQLNYVPKEIMEAKVNWTDAYVRIVSIDNTRELSQIPSEKIRTTDKHIRPYFDRIIDSDRWALTYYPTSSMAQEAGVAFDWLMDFYFKSCIVDYRKMEQDLKKLEKVLDGGSQVRIVGKDTDLTFSIKGRLAKAAYGERNIPDGEVFLAPVKETTEGTVYFDFPTTADGVEVNDIYLEFKQGKVTKAKSSLGTIALQKKLNADAGARYLGELGVGANYNIKRGMKNTLFDEKIGGTIHLALGRSYREKRGGAPERHNESIIHWDIVKDMRKKDSVLYVDNKPVMKEGKFLS